MSAPHSEPPRDVSRSARRAPRRKPRQERSLHTVDVILQATKRLVVQVGLDKVTTNGVARLAGVSIGSLYQYFPSKRALISELRRRHQEVGERLLLAEAQDLVGATLPQVARRFVERMLEVHREDPALHRALELEGRGAGFNPAEKRMLAVIRAFLETRRSELTVTDLDQAAFVVGSVVEGITHAAVLERNELLHDASLVDGIVHMLLAYLTTPRSP